VLLPNISDIFGFSSTVLSFSISLLISYLF
jgi:hypothetical protein